MTGYREVNAPEKTEGNDNVKVARKVSYMYGQWLSMATKQVETCCVYAILHICTLIRLIVGLAVAHHAINKIDTLHKHKRALQLK